MKKRVFSLMDRMFNFIPEEGKANERYDIFFNSDKEPIILIDTEEYDITFSTIHMDTVMSILGISDRNFLKTEYGRNFNDSVLEWAKQRFDSHYTINEWYKSTDLMGYL
jgi:hypothetical protein